MISGENVGGGSLVYTSVFLSPEVVVERFARFERLMENPKQAVKDGTLTQGRDVFGKVEYKLAKP